MTHFTNGVDGRMAIVNDQESKGIGYTMATSYSYTTNLNVAFKHLSSVSTFQHW